MNYPLSFQKLIDDCQKKNQYVGLGNPAAKILFVGKEPGIPKDKKNEHGTAASWLERDDLAQRYIPNNKYGLRNKKHTWQKYQLLYEEIIKRLGSEEIQKSDYEITFVDKIFTTELNELHAKNSSEAVKRNGFKERLDKRKEEFFAKDFIRNFPITVIFGFDGKYLNGRKGEVYNVFNVCDAKMKPLGKSRMWIHSAPEGSASPKLLIHTRQLTNGASNELIYAVADEVVKFIRNNPELVIEEQLLAVATKFQS